MNDLQPIYSLDLKTEMRPNGLKWLRIYLVIGRERIIEQIWAIYKALGVECNVSDIVREVDSDMKKILIDSKQNARDLTLTLLLLRHPDNFMAKRKDARADPVMYFLDLVFNWILENQIIKVIHRVTGTNPLSLNPKSTDALRLVFWYPDLVKNTSDPDFIDAITEVLAELKFNGAKMKEDNRGLTLKLDSAPAGIQRLHNARRLPSAELLATAGHKRILICCLTDGIGTNFHQKDRAGNYLGPIDNEGRRVRLLSGGHEECHIQIFLPPWSVVAWDPAGEPRENTDRLFGKLGWWIPADEMMEFRVAEAIVCPRELHETLDEHDSFDVEQFIDDIIATAVLPRVLKTIEAISAEHMKFVAHGRDKA